MAGPKQALTALLLALALAHPAAADTQQPSGIVFGHDFFDSGQVEEGSVVTHSFPFKNVGPGPVKITGAETSCGCTTAKADFREYAPGEAGEMTVTVDTRGKRGIVTKTIDVSMEGAGAGGKQLVLMITLVPPPHPKVENVLDVVRDPKCKTCHLDSGVGQSGEYLYHRVCAQCHGAKGKGASAMALNTKEWLAAKNDDELAGIIRNGDPERGMPPYAAGVEPPLTEEQVKSLTGYLRSLADRNGP